MADTKESAEQESVRATVMSTLHDVVDPEVGMNIVDLGLVYGVELTETTVAVSLTMTTPACPLGEHIVEEARRLLADALPSKQVDVSLTWDPPWTPARMSESARRELGWND